MSNLPDVTHHFHPVLETKKLKKKPVKVTIAGRDYVLFRDHSGKPAALEDQCPHRFAPLSLGKVRPDGRLACAYHGWNFDSHGNGLSPSQSIQCKAKSFQVVEKFGFLWMAARETPLSHFPVFGDLPHFQYAGGFSLLFDAPLHTVITNGFEAEHLPFVHQFFGWDEKDAAKVTFRSEIHPDHITADYDAPSRDTPLNKLFSVRKGDIFHTKFIAWFSPIYITVSAYVTAPNSDKVRGEEFGPVLFWVPETATTTRVHAFVFVKYNQPVMRLISPILNPFLRLIYRYEIKRDGDFVKRLSHIPEDMSGMRLGRFDKPIIHFIKKTHSKYFNQSEPQPESAQITP